MLLESLDSREGLEALKWDKANVAGQVLLKEMEELLRGGLVCCSECVDCFMAGKCNRFRIK